MSIVIGLKIRTNFPENHCHLPKKLTSSAFSEHISQIKLVHSNILVIIQLYLIPFFNTIQRDIHSDNDK